MRNNKLLLVIYTTMFGKTCNESKDNGHILLVIELIFFNVINVLNLLNTYCVLEIVLNTL